MRLPVGLHVGVAMAKEWGVAITAGDAEKLQGLLMLLHSCWDWPVRDARWPMYRKMQAYLLGEEWENL